MPYCKPLARSKGVAMVTKVLCCCQSQQRRTVSLDGSLSGYMLLSGTAERTISLYVGLSGYMLLSVAAEEDK